MSKTIPKVNFPNIEFLCSSSERKDSVIAFIQEWNNSNDFLFVKTSGSTGKPKEFKVLKKYFVESAKLTGQFFNFKKDDKVILALSIDTIGGKMQVIRALLFEMNLLVFDNSRNPIKNLKEKVSFISLAPIQVEEILTKNKEKLELIETCLIGGAAISFSLEQKLKVVHSSFYESYGMTETLSHIALRNVKKDISFKTLEGVSIDVEDDCLMISAPYLGLKDLKTNDLVEILSENEFIIKGRKDFVINSGGFKYHPELLEKKIAQKIDTDFFIIGEKNQEFGEIISLFIEGVYSTEKMDFLNHVFSTCLEKYEIPKKVYFVEEFFRTESNKIQRKETQNLIFENR
jgi:o-succinylbenzoate---CoA ligase